MTTPISPELIEAMRLLGLRPEDAHQLSPYEINRLREVREEPRHDFDIVPGATLDDFEPTALKRLLGAVRDRLTRPFVFLSRHELLEGIGAIRPDGAVRRPTLAGLLAAGRKPQRFFPSLQIVFTRWAGTPGDAERLRTKELTGSIPDILLDALDQMRLNMREPAIITGALRRNYPDYSTKAVLEALTNALQHRDYSAESRGMPVRIDMYDDRLEISSPGGPLRGGGLGMVDGIRPIRNQYLTRLLASTPLMGGFAVEDSGWGFAAIREALEKDGLPEVRIRHSLANFVVTFPKRPWPIA